MKLTPVMYAIKGYLAAKGLSEKRYLVEDGFHPQLELDYLSIAKHKFGVSNPTMPTCVEQVPQGMLEDEDFVLGEDEGEDEAGDDSDSDDNDAEGDDDRVNTPVASKEPTSTDTSAVPTEPKAEQTVGTVSEPTNPSPEAGQPQNQEGKDTLDDKVNETVNESANKSEVE